MRFTLRRIGGGLLAVTGFFACPCHLIVTLPLFIIVLAGTALGSFLAHNTDLIYAFASIYFVVALALGIHFLVKPAPKTRRAGQACPMCVPLTTTQRTEKELSAPRR